MSHKSNAETVGQPSPVSVSYEDGIALVLIDNPPVNAGSQAVRRGLLERIERLDAIQDLVAAVIVGEGKTFVAGSDLREFGKPLEEPQWPDVFAAIERSRLPVIAAIHGAALGGGYELALACDWRVATADAVVGLPEINLGMIPGAGGTQRLPRLTGVAAAIEVITSGRHVSAEEALELGMVDAVTEDDLISFAASFAKSTGSVKRQTSMLELPADLDQEVELSARAARNRGRGRANVETAIETIRLAQTLPVAEALKVERQRFQSLREGEEAAALRYNFFAERQATKHSDLDGEPKKIETIAVVGSGTMGSGIATVLLAAGYRTRLVDADPAALEAAHGRIADGLEKLEARDKLKTSAAAALSGLMTGGRLEDCKASDLVIEAVYEDMNVKSDVLEQLGKVLDPQAIIATNTSYLDINALARKSGRPDRFLGLHFFAPVPRMRLLEVVGAQETSPGVLKTGLALGKRIGKLAIRAGACEGFIGNRIYSRYRAQCEFMLEDGALPQMIDAAIEEMGFAMGPFAVADLSGLDIAWRHRQRRAPDRDPRERYVPLPDHLCEQGRLGRKTGAGWYSYPDPAAHGVVDPVVTAMVEERARERGAQAPNAKEIQARALGAIVNEAALIMAEGMARSASDIDLVLVNGYGFSKHRGGPLYQASLLPQEYVTRAVDMVQEATGYGFRRGDVEALLDQIG